MSRINLDDQLSDVIVKMSEGNPGAATVLLGILEKAPTVDPANPFGGFMMLIHLDEYELYGPSIWVLYKDICGEHIGTTIAVLRAVQLGIITQAELVDNVKRCWMFRGLVSPLWVRGCVSEVSKQLPDFNVNG